MSVCVTKLTLEGSTTGRREFSEEVFDLKRANTDRVSLFVLAPEGHRYVDIAHISERGPLAILTSICNQFFRGYANAGLECIQEIIVPKSL